MRLSPFVFLLLFTLGTASAEPRWADEGPLRPVGDYHQHLMSAMAAASENQDVLLEKVLLPASVTSLLVAQVAGWNSEEKLTPLFTEDAAAIESLDRKFARGGAKAAELLAGTFRGPYTMVPVAYSARSGGGYVAGYFTRGKGAALKRFGNFVLALSRSKTGWHIAAETLIFPGPGITSTVDGDQLVALLDEAGIRRAVVLSLAYFYGSPLSPPVEHEYDKVKAENDWTAAQVARHPDRLVAFCGVNPLKDYAIAEIDRCASQLHMRGMKLHFGNSGVDVKNPEHVKKVRALFAEANTLRLPIVAHLWTLDPNYGKPDAEIFLNQILPAAPDVVVQIAHMAGAGSGGNDAAFEVYADAIVAGDPRTRNLYFDVTTVADDQTAEQDRLLAQQIRKVGPERILFGSDGSWTGNTPRKEWGNFHGMVPLSEREFAIIAHNVPPYLR